MIVPCDLHQLRTWLDVIDDIKYSAQNGVITITGDVNSIERRNEIEHLAASVPNVKQVVNELQVKEMKATSRK